MLPVIMISDFSFLLVKSYTTSVNSYEADNIAQAALSAYSAVAFADYL